MNQRKNRWDWYRWILFAVYCLEIWIGMNLLQRFFENHELYSQIGLATEQENPDTDAHAGVSGEILFEIKTERDSQELIFEKMIREELKLHHPLYVRGVWSHRVRHGKPSYMVRDREIKLGYKFRVKNRNMQFQPDLDSQRVFSFHNIRFKQDSIFSKLVPKAEIVDIEYFCPSKLWLIGKVGPKENGIRFVRGTPDFPLVVSEVAPGDLVSGLFNALLATAVSLSYLLITFFTRIQPRLKSAFEDNPGNFFIFDVTKGSERYALGFFILYGIGAALILKYLTPTHSFHVDLMQALLAIGFFVLVHAAKGVEFFYVADKIEKHLFEVSRGFFSEYKIRRESLNEINPYIKTIPGYRYSTNYQLKTKNLTGEMNLSDSSTFRGPLEETLKEFNNFRKV